MTFVLALLVGVFALPCAAYGAGELDPTFDGDGRVVTDFASNETAREVAIQADGKIVGVGTRFDDFALARYNSDGSLDTTFDGDGRVVTDFGDLDGGSGVAIQADGKIIAVGTSNVGGSPYFALARYNSDGSLDATFDGDGRVLTNFGFAVDISIQDDGKIIAVGSSEAETFNLNFALARYNSDGSLDATFDGDGRVVTDFGDTDGARGVAIQAGGKIVAAGVSDAGALNDHNFALARYNANGTLDATFDGDGRVLTDLRDTDDARGVAIQTDGKIVAAGSSIADDASLDDFALARYNPDGGLDATFDGDGKVLTGFGDFDVDQGDDVALQTDGKIVVAGVSNAGVGDDFALARYNPDGGLDATFDGDGRVLTNFSGSGTDVAFGVALQGDGKIVAAGTTDSRAVADFDFALARYLDGVPNLPPDCSTVAVGTNRLWPPNHRLSLVTLSGATDPDGDTVTLTISAVTQDEPLNGSGDGNTSPDARAGSAPNNVLLRAERSGRGDGRVYRVSFTGSDGKGESCSGTVTVGVPRNRGSTAIDSAPPSVNSFGP